jgi:hypothetical protein
MNTLIRFFALFVAIAGLACASLTPANPKTRNSQNSIALPGPITCQELNTCLAPAASTR